AAAEQMQVEVWHRLPRLLQAVQHQAIAVAQAQLRRQLRRHQVQVAQQRLVLFLHVGVGRNHLLRDDQDVDRRLRIDIAKRQALIVLVDDVGGDLSLDDLEKEVVGHHGCVLYRSSFSFFVLHSSLKRGKATRQMKNEEWKMKK